MKILVLGESVLETKAEPVTDFGSELQSLVTEMFKVMLEAHGVGLAAPQIGVSKQVAVIGLDGKGFVMVNPHGYTGAGNQMATEGCLSIPGFQYITARPLFVAMPCQNLKGEHYILEGEGLMARVIMHEYEHLQGKLFIGDGKKVRAKAEKFLSKILARGSS